MNEETVEVKKHSPANARAGVVAGELPPVGHCWMTHRIEEAQALEKLGAVCKAMVRYPTGDMVFVFDRVDAEAHYGYEVRKAVAEQDAVDSMSDGMRDLVSLVDWARSGK